jgi:hypothetical protein
VHLLIWSALRKLRFAVRTLEYETADAAHDECDYHNPEPNPPGNTTEQASSHVSHVRSPPEEHLFQPMSLQASSVHLVEQETASYQQSMNRQMQHTMNAITATQSQNHHGQKNWLVVTSAMPGHLLR